MKQTRDTIEAALKLKDSPMWRAIIGHLRAQRALEANAVIYGDCITEYQRAILAGRVQSLDAVLALADATEKDLEKFGTK